MMIILLGAFLVLLSPADDDTGNEILQKVDFVTNAPGDQSMNMNLVLIGKDGTTREREIVIYQKGSDRRMGKFLSPADQKGIAFLSLPDGIMYIYLPAFKKTRRIASHVKNTKFAGTNFTYEDMEAGKYVDKYTSEILEHGNGYYILKLIPKSENQSDYSMLKLWVEDEKFLPTKIEYYDKGNSLSKVMTRGKVEKIEGYWIAKETEMSDLKTGQKTRMILRQIEFDQNLPDNLFTERYLKR
jgi:outer membrane lipoprotein-sorting protein